VRAARDLLSAARAELAGVEERLRSHPALDSFPPERLRRFAGEQFTILSSDRRSFAHLAARFPEPPAGDLFLDLAHGEGVALERLGQLGFDYLDRHEPHPAAHAYTAYVAWLALNGSRAAVALAFAANLAAWGESCGRLAALLRNEVDVSFFEFFAEPPADFEDRLLEVVEQGLGEGDSPERARVAARLLQAYELQFWDALVQR